MLLDINILSVSFRTPTKLNLYPTIYILYPIIAFEIRKNNQILNDLCVPRYLVSIIHTDYIEKLPPSFFLK